MSTGSWERALWKRQPYPDNYIPSEAFLESLRTNPNFRPYTYWPLVLAACAVTQHLATIFTFLGVFVRLKERLLDPRVLIYLSIGCFPLGYMVWETFDTNHESNHTRRMEPIKSSILIFLALMALSPVLKTLTAATSSDTIWALSACLFGLNVLFADHSSVRLGDRIRERLTSVLSMNAALLASVVLASRLPYDVAVFALILFSVQLFILFPMLCHRLQTAPTVVHSLLTIALCTFALVLTASLSILVTCLYALTLFFVTFLAPAVLLWAQKYKNEIRGAWDQAVPKVNPSSHSPSRENGRI